MSRVLNLSLTSSRSQLTRIRASVSRLPVSAAPYQKLHARRPMSTPALPGEVAPVAPASGLASSTSNVSTARVVVMSTPACTYCKRAKDTLDKLGVAYVDVSVEAYAPLRQKVKDVTGSRTVPQIFLGGRSVGGNDDLQAAVADGSFAAALQREAAAGSAALPPDLLQLVMEAQRQHEQQAGPGPSSATAALRELEGRMLGPGGLPRTERKIGDRTLRTFMAGSLLEWLRAAGEADPRATARQLLQANRISGAAATAAEGQVPLDLDQPTLLLTAVAEAPPPSRGQPLNGHYWWQGPARPAGQVVSSLRSRILELYDAHLSPDGRAVDYRALSADPRFRAFVDETAELQKVDLSPLGRSELMAFAINTYNALIVHALVALGTRMGAAQRATFFSRAAAYLVAPPSGEGAAPGASPEPVVYSADDLEHGVLRGNRAGAANLWTRLGWHGLAGGHWTNNDPRNRKIVLPRDPRIHFALVCGARSCPPIKLYSADNLEEGLQAAAEAFCAGEVAVDAARREVTLSKIFDWYGIDFGATDAERLQTISQWTPEPTKGQLLGLLRDGGKVSVRYKPYDWSVNGTDV